jgi:phage terminase large subunit-like protein
LSKKKPQTRAQRNIDWCEQYIVIPEGKFVGQQLKMAEFMKDDFRAIFDNPHGTRRAIISRGRKNAKTVETAMLMLLFLCGPEAKPNSQLFSAAQSREQAGVLFALAAKMVRLSPSLSAVCGIRDTAKQIYCQELGTLYRALSAEASTAFGLSPRFLAHDELGQSKGPRSPLYEALETATAAQDDPLSIIISTQAPTDGDLLSVLIDDAQTGADPRTVLRMQFAPEGMDPFSEEAIRTANPAFDVFMNKAEVLAMAEDARRMPSRQSEFENLVLNRRVDMNAPFISRTAWTACAGPVVEDFDGLPVFGGLDLSEVNDLTALVLVAPVEKVWHVKPTFWLPAMNLADKARSDRVPYDLWHREGWLNTTPGPTVDYEFIADHLAGIVDRYDVRKIAFDRWNWRHLKPWLAKAGFTEEQLEGDAAIFEQMGQGFQSMSPALRDLESAILNEKIAHGGHPVLTMCASNATVQADPAGNRKLSKSKSHGRIDGMVALAMAMSVAGTHEDEARMPLSPWEDPNYRMAL